jgi:transcriptional regulator with XRE-family HTH domain
MANITRKERTARGFGQALKASRKERKMAIQALSSASGVNIGNISKMERGLGLPRLDTAWKLADALGVKLDSLRPKG